MNLKTDKLQASLSQEILPIYVVSGDEHLLVQESLDAIRSAAARGGFTERVVFDVDSKFDWNQVLSETQMLSLFGNKKILELRIDNGKLSDKASHALFEILNSLSLDHMLLLILPAIDRSTKNSEWFKKMSLVGAHIDIHPVKVAQLPSWIEKRLNNANISISRDKIQILADRVEGNLLAAAQEIEKLKLLSQNDEVDELTLSTIVTESTRYDVFDLVNKILEGDRLSTGKILRGLQSEGIQPLPILWAILSELRKLLKASHLISRGKETNKALLQAGVWRNKVSSMRVILKRSKMAHLRMLLYQASAIDRGVKGLRESDVWDELSTLALSLSGTQILSPISIKHAVDN